MKKVLCAIIMTIPFAFQGCGCSDGKSSGSGPLIGVAGDGMVIEIAGNGIDDNGNGLVDESGSIAVDSQLTTSGEHADMVKPFYAAGSLVDSVDMGSLHWNQASGDTKADEGDWDNSFGEHNGSVDEGTNIYDYCFYYGSRTVSWEFSVPSPGYYILSIFSWSNDSRRIYPSYDNGTEVIELPDSNHEIDMYLVHFDSAGSHRVNALGSNSYIFHSQLFGVRISPQSTHAAHPRISVNPGSLGAFRDRINSSWINRLTNDCINDADWIVSDVDVNSFSQYSPREHQGDMLDLAVAYLSTGNANYARYGIEALRNIVHQPHLMEGASWSYLGIGEYILAISLCYDYFYDAMTPDERTEILELADMHINYLYVHSLNARHRGDGDHWWSAKDSNNWNAVVNGGGLGLAALCFENDNRYAPQWLDLAEKTQQYFLDNSFDRDGAYNESYMYLEYAAGSASLFYKAMLENRGNGLIHRNNNAFLKSVHTAMYFWEPSKQEASPFNQDTRWGVDWNYRYVFLRPSWFTAAGVYNDGMIQKYLQSTFGDGMQNDRYHDYAAFAPLCVLGYSPVEETPYAEWDMPLSKAWPGFGRTVMRTGFESREDYYFAMECGLYGSHGHADQSSFIIHALGHVLADDNYYDNIDTGSQNAILVDGQGQARSDWNVYAGSTGHFMDTSILDFVSAESSAGYIENGIDLDFNIRNVLFVEPSAHSNGYYVIADHVSAATSHSYEWGIHRQAQGPAITSSGSGNYLFDGDDADLEIRFASPQGPTHAVSSDKLAVASPSSATEEHFTVLLYPTDAAHVMPAVTKINDASFSGFSLGSDLVLYNKTKTLNTYSDITTDAELSFRRTAGGGTYLAMFRGKRLSTGSIRIQSDVTTNMVCSVESGSIRIDIGDTISETGSAAVSITGLSDGSYSYSLDGVSQAGVTVTGGTFSRTISISGQRRLVLSLL